MNWHPRITLYRLTVILSTIGFGTAKAVYAHQGKEFISITIDWIMGVVLFLVLFATSIYDAEDSRPRYCAWVFKRDLLDLLWALLESKFTFQRPRYLSHELSIPAMNDSASRPHLHITHYRLLVSMVVISFGMSKAILAYLGYQTGATWLEWAFGVGVTSMLYALGLYETYPIRNPGLLIPERDIDAVSHPHPRVTYYRLFVFVIIFGFGTVKAILAHAGDQTEANWMDWAVGVGAMSILYTLGLYERNSLRAWSGFFMVDRRREVAKFLNVITEVIFIFIFIIYGCALFLGLFL